MNRNDRRTATRLGRESRIKWRLRSRAAQERALERLKQRLLLPLMNSNLEPAFNAPVRRAANDAAALAWTTPYPLLVFPVLLEEKTATARVQALRQEEIRKRSRALIQEVA